MRISKLFILFFLGFICAVTILFVFASKPAAKSGTLVFSHVATLDSVPLMLAEAVTSAEWQQGLSGTKPLAPNQGLLFLFDHADTWGIWMKDMLFPIDVLWFDQNMRIMYSKENFSPASYPEVATPSSPASTVLELPAGFVELHQIHIGDQLFLTETKP